MITPGNHEVARQGVTRPPPVILQLTSLGYDKRFAYPSTGAKAASAGQTVPGVRGLAPAAQNSSDMPPTVAHLRDHVWSFNWGEVAEGREATRRRLASRERRVGTGDHGALILTVERMLE